MFFNPAVIIETDRLILRPWREEDLIPFAALTADSRVMEYYPSTLAKEESDQLGTAILNEINEQGWGLWAVSAPGVSDFIGYIGLNKVRFQAHFTPTIEIGWRLAYEYWGRGFATEGAQATLKFGFEKLQLSEIVSFTAVHNMRSRRVMEKIGMHYQVGEDFDHPRLPKEHPLCRHVLYRLKQNEWEPANL